MQDLLEAEFWNWLTIGSVGLGLVAAIVFAVRFQIEAGWSWWSNPFGRFLMTRDLMLSALFIIVLLNRTLDSWPGRQMITALLMLAFAVQTFVPYRLLVKVQRQQQNAATTPDDTDGRR